MGRVPIWKLGLYAHEPESSLSYADWQRASKRLTLGCATPPRKKCATLDFIALGLVASLSSPDLGILRPAPGPHPPAFWLSCLARADFYFGFILKTTF